jgi:hypothetical protein
MASGSTDISTQGLKMMLIFYLFRGGARKVTFHRHCQAEPFSALGLMSVPHVPKLPASAHHNSSTNNALILIHCSSICISRTLASLVFVAAKITVTTFALVRNATYMFRTSNCRRCPFAALQMCHRMSLRAPVEVVNECCSCIVRYKDRFQKDCKS